MMLDKIKLEKLQKKDWIIFEHALNYYLEYLTFLTQTDGNAQQYIHCSLCIQLMERVKPKLLKRSFPEVSSLKLEISEGYVLHDALRHFTTLQIAHDYERAISRRLILDTGAKLPAVTDLDQYSVESQL